MRSSTASRPARSQRISRPALGLGIAVAIVSAAAASPAFALAASADPVTAATSAAAPAAATEQSTFDVADAATDAATAAQKATEAAGALDATVKKSGLKVDAAAVNTAELDKAMQEMAVLRAMGSSLLTDVTARVADATEPVVADTAVLKKSYDTAVKAEEKRKAEEAAAKKAAEEAAAKKAAEEAAAKKAAEEAAAQEASDSSSNDSSDSSSDQGSSNPVGGATPVPSGGSDPDSARATARAMLANYGWGDDQWGCLDSLWMKESGWSVTAYNPSGATGIPQALPGDKMASAGADWRTNAATQIAWGLGYIQGVYGSPCSAWGHSQAVNWY